MIPRVRKRLTSRGLERHRHVCGLFFSTQWLHVYSVVVRMCRPINTGISKFQPPLKYGKLGELWRTSGEISRTLSQLVGNSQTAWDVTSTSLQITVDNGRSTQLRIGYIHDVSFHSPTLHMFIHSTTTYPLRCKCFAELLSLAKIGFLGHGEVLVGDDTAAGRRLMMITISKSSRSQKQYWEVNECTELTAFVAYFKTLKRPHQRMLGNAGKDYNYIQYYCFTHPLHPRHSSSRGECRSPTRSWEKDASLQFHLLFSITNGTILTISVHCVRWRRHN